MHIFYPNDNAFPVTNCIRKYLNKLVNFFFIPTQYCNMLSLLCANKYKYTVNTYYVCWIPGNCKWNILCIWKKTVYK